MPRPVARGGRESWPTAPEQDQLLARPPITEPIPSRSPTTGCAVRVWPGRTLCGRAAVRAVAVSEGGVDRRCSSLLQLNGAYGGLPDSDPRRWQLQPGVPAAAHVLLLAAPPGRRGLFRRWPHAALLRIVPLTACSAGDAVLRHRNSSCPLVQPCGHSAHVDTGTVLQRFFSNLLQGEHVHALFHVVVLAARSFTCTHVCLVACMITWPSAQGHRHLRQPGLDFSNRCVEPRRALCECSPRRRCFAAAAPMHAGAPADRRCCMSEVLFVAGHWNDSPDSGTVPVALETR